MDSRHVIRAHSPPLVRWKGRKELLRQPERIPRRRRRIAMKRYQGRRGEIAGVIGVVLIGLVVLVGCSTPERSAKMTALRNHYGHVSLQSAKTAGPAVGRGGGGGGAHGDWMSGETRGQLEIAELAGKGVLPLYGPGTGAIEDQEIVEMPEVEGIEGEDVTMGVGPDEWQNPDLRPRGAAVDPTLAASSELKTIYFDFDAAEIREDQMETLRSNAKWLRDHPSVAVNLNGHCDERGTEEYNMALSEKRATSVRESLISMGVQPHRLSAVPFGEAAPADPLHSEEAWAVNRRVEFAATSVQLLSMDFSE
jgi:peptidoglycan-associated lipoprotein